MPFDDVHARIDHTVLGPETTSEDVIEGLDAAIAYGTGTLIPPCYVSLADSYAPGVRLSTVIGFPDGQHHPSIKAAEAERAHRDGVDALAVVPNAGRLRAGEDEETRRDLAEPIAATPLPVTVIVRTSLSSDEELDRIGQFAAEAGAESIGTATGCEGDAVTVSDVERLSRYLPVTVGDPVDSWQRATTLFEAGADRIATTRGDVLLENYRQDETR